MKYFSFLLIITIAVSSCNIIDGHRVRGNGKMITRGYELKNFNGIDAGGNMNIRVKQDSVFSVKIETDENLFRYLDVRVDEEGVLQVGTQDHVWVNPTREIKIFVSMPSADKWIASGASELQTDGKFSQEKPIYIELSGASNGKILVRSPKVELEASGASTLTIEGETRDIKAGASGASTINAYGLKSENANAEASGASTIRVFSSISLNAEASGASGIRYKGYPKVTSDASGASSVGKED